MKVTFTNGFKCELSDDFFNNMELIDAIAEMEKDEDYLAISRVATLIFGKNKKALYDSIREEDGRVPVEKISLAIKETFEAFGKHEKKS